MRIVIRFVVRLIVDNEKVLPRTGYVHIAFSVGSKASVDTLTESYEGAGCQKCPYRGTEISD